ncbi:MAG TPA: hypothetical protein VIX41_02135, partial [Acidimicrobiales bacterium]
TDEPLPTAGEDLEDLPLFGTFTPPPPPGAMRFKIPSDLSNIYDVIEVPDKTPPQRIRVTFDRDHPLLIVQSPQGRSNGEPFEARLTNNERARGKDKAVIASDLDYLLRALGDRTKPKSNREYMQALQRHGGKEFGADLRYSWRCSRDRDIRARDGAGQVQVVEGKKGCGESYYQEDVPKNAAGEVPYEINCGQCGALLRAFANLDNIRS